MADNFSWSANIGRWLGVPVRVHLLLFLFVAILFGSEWNYSSNNANFFVGTAMVTVVVLLLSIVLHELAHVFALNNLGGHANTLVLMPWGGNSDFVLPSHGPSRALIYLSGPFANGALFALGTTLLVQSEHSTLFNLVNPFEPHWFDASNWQITLTEIVTWLNFQLFIANLIPCFPFDGAGVVRAWIVSMNTGLPKFRVESAIKLIGNAVAFASIGMAWFVRDFQVGPIYPTWLLFLLIGITLIFASQYSLDQETQEVDSDWEDVEDIDYDSIYSETTFFDFAEETENTAYSQWLQEKQEARREHELRCEEEEDRQADEILKKLHNVGEVASLSDEERTILDRVSARIRKRRQQGV